MSDEPDCPHFWKFSRGDEFFGSIRRRIVLSLAAMLGWVSFALLFVAFWAHEFSLFQGIVVIVVSLLVLFGLVAGAWISFGMRFARGWSY
jgi:hypothetical protein